jgi:ribose transport system permease protein
VKIDLKNILKSREFAIFILLLAVCIATSALNPIFISPTNLQNTARLIGLFGIFSIGIGLVIITSGIDLSVGSSMALLGVMLSILLQNSPLPPPISALIVLLAATAIGWLHGFLVTKVKIQPFIVTLCGLLVYRGIARFWTKDNTMGFSVSDSANDPYLSLRSLANGSIVGIPTPFVLLVILSVVMFFVLHRSVWGRYLFAVGRNEEAARYAGIASGKIITSAYILCGMLTGVSAILFSFFTNSISPSSHGNFYELYGVAAAVVGGCSLRGGEGSIIGILLGATLLQVLPNLVNLLNIPTSLNFAVMGAVIFIGVLADQLLRGKRR